MSENTKHPTQKPEKLVAKLLLASSKPGDLVLDPFLGSGTTAVVARKLGRRFVGIEMDEEHCLASWRRLELAAEDPRIQGYDDEVFWERGAAPRKARRSSREKPSAPFLDAEDEEDR
jgi:site-specific DNA-methyltransferase (adenine-specific)